MADTEELAVWCRLCNELVFLPHTDHVERYGFRYGPAEVTRLAHIPGRGYWLAIETDHKTLEVHVSESGRRITVVSVPA